MLVVLPASSTPAFLALFQAVAPRHSRELQHQERRRGLNQILDDNDILRAYSTSLHRLCQPLFANPSTAQCVSSTAGASLSTGAFALFGRPRLPVGFPVAVGANSATLSAADADADDSVFRAGTIDFAAHRTKKLAMATNPAEPKTNVTTYSNVRCNKVPPSNEGNFNLAIVDTPLFFYVEFT